MLHNPKAMDFHVFQMAAVIVCSGIEEGECHRSTAQGAGDPSTRGRDVGRRTGKPGDAAQGKSCSVSTYLMQVW